MISAAAFTLMLLLAGATVPQVFSRPVLLLVFDSINPSHIVQMPNLDKGGKWGKYIARPRLLKSENPTTAFSFLHTIATGVLPNVHGVISNVMFDKKGAIMSNKEEQYKFDETIIPIWTEAVQKGKTTATYMWPGADFLMQNVQPIVSEKYPWCINKDNNVAGEAGAVTTNPAKIQHKAMGIPWESRVSVIKNWFQTGSIQFGMAYFEDDNYLDNDLTYINKVYETIQNIYNELKDLDVDIITMTRGKKSVYRDYILVIDDYLRTCKRAKQCEFLTSGGISFVRFWNNATLETTYQELRRKPDYDKRFKVFKREDADMTEWNLKGFALLQNTLIVVAMRDYAFYDSFREGNITGNGLNKLRVTGFPKSDYEMNGILLLKGPSFKDDVVAQHVQIQLTDVYPLIKKLLGLNERASDKQKVEDLSDNMKELIEDETLKEWGLI